MKHSGCNSLEPVKSRHVMPVFVSEKHVGDSLDSVPSWHTPKLLNVHHKDGGCRTSEHLELGALWINYVDFKYCDPLSCT